MVFCDFLSSCGSPPQPGVDEVRHWVKKGGPQQGCRGKLIMIDFQCKSIPRDELSWTTVSLFRPISPLYVYRTPPAPWRGAA